MGNAVLHLVESNHTVDILGGYRTKIIAEVDGVALRVGRLLREAREAAPREFDRWVERDLPFGSETARRLMAISAAYEKLPTETLRGLPRPWQAMYALKALPPEALVAAVAAGEISADMTVEAAKQYARSTRSKYHFLYCKADLAAGRLMRAQPEDLSKRVRQDLQTWLAG